jgi:hypothetical protein
MRVTAGFSTWRGTRSTFWSMICCRIAVREDDVQGGVGRVQIKGSGGTRSRTDATRSTSQQLVSPWSGGGRGAGEAAPARQAWLGLSEPLGQSVAGRHSSRRWRLVVVNLGRWDS